MVLGDLVGGAGVAELLRHPDAPVVAERLAHERELRLELVTCRDARGVDLGEARVREERAPPVRPPRGGHVAALGVGGEEEDVPVAAGRQHHRVRGVRADLAGREVAHHDAAGAPVLDHDVEHLGARVHLDRAEVDLTRQRLIRAEQQLLAGLAAGVERARHLRAAEGPGVEEAAVLAGEGHALGDALVDDVQAQLREPIDVRLARAVVAALHGVVEEAEHAVAVVLVVLGGVDAALGGNAVRAPGRVLEAERLHLVAELAQRRRGGGAGEAGADHDHLEAPLVRGVHQLHVEAVLVPLLLDRPRGDVVVEDDGAGAHSTTPARTAIGTLMKPMVTTAAKAMANGRRTGFSRGLLSPTLWKRLQAPWYRWKPRARLATM